MKATDHPLELGKSRATTTPYTSVLLQPGGARNKGKPKETPVNQIAKSEKAQRIVNKPLQEDKNQQGILPSIRIREKDNSVEPVTLLPRGGIKQNVSSQTTETPWNGNSTNSAYQYYPGRRQFEKSKEDGNGWVEEEDSEPIHQLKVGDWVAVWDTEFSTWYFHNLATKASTWDKPKELEHLNFRDMGGNRREGRPDSGWLHMIWLFDVDLKTFIT